VLKDLESQAKMVSDNLTYLIGGLQAQLFAVTPLIKVEFGEAQYADGGNRILR